MNRFRLSLLGTPQNGANKVNSAESVVYTQINLGLWIVTLTVGICIGIGANRNKVPTFGDSYTINTGAIAWVLSCLIFPLGSTVIFNVLGWFLRISSIGALGLLLGLVYMVVRYKQRRTILGGKPGASESASKVQTSGYRESASDGAHPAHS